MSSMPRDEPTRALPPVLPPALAAAVGRLEAERLAPVPRARRAVAVDVDDLALVLDHVASTLTARPRLSEAAASAYGRLDDLLRRHATAPAAG
jgi:predicted component of type VI protein secretion system